MLVSTTFGTSVRLGHFCGCLIGISTLRPAWCRCRDDIVVGGPRGYGTVGIARCGYYCAVDLRVGASGDRGAVHVIARNSRSGITP